MAAQHAGAGARRGDHVIEALEGVHDLDGDRPGRGAVAGIIGGLAAAGLIERRLDPAAGVLEQADGGKGDGGAKQIGETGDEQPDARGIFLRSIGHDRVSARALGNSRT